MDGSIIRTHLSEFRYKSNISHRLLRLLCLLGTFCIPLESLCYNYVDGILFKAISGNIKLIWDGLLTWVVIVVYVQKKLCSYKSHDHKQGVLVGLACSSSHKFNHNFL